MMTPEKIWRHYEGPHNTTIGPGYFVWLWIAKSLQERRCCWELHFSPAGRRFTLYKGFWQAEGVAEFETHIRGLCQQHSTNTIEAFRACLSPKDIARCTAAALRASPEQVYRNTMLHFYEDLTG